MAIAPDQITAIVLCGGRGRRVGGRDKPLLCYRGRQLIASVTDALKGTVAGVLVSANRNLDAYARFGTVIRDEVPNGGPLAGIASCLQRCSTPYAFVCPGDAPDLEAAVVVRLANALTDDVAITVAHDGQRRQHLHMMLRRDVGPTIRAYLSSGRRSVWQWLATQRVAEVDLSDLAGCFVDVDDTAQLTAG